MAGADAPTAEFSYDVESRATAPTDGVEKDQAKTTIYRTGSIILDDLLETGQRMAGVLGNHQSQNCRRLKQNEVLKVLADKSRNREPGRPRHRTSHANHSTDRALKVTGTASRRMNASW
jgi:hypothetical protein